MKLWRLIWMVALNETRDRASCVYEIWMRKHLNFNSFILIKNCFRSMTWIEWENLRYFLIIYIFSKKNKLLLAALFTWVIAKQTQFLKRIYKKNIMISFFWRSPTDNTLYFVLMYLYGLQGVEGVVLILNSLQMNLKLSPQLIRQRQPIQMTRTGQIAPLMDREALVLTPRVGEERRGLECCRRPDSFFEWWYTCPKVKQPLTNRA